MVVGLDWALWLHTSLVTVARQSNGMLCFWFWTWSTSNHQLPQLDKQLSALASSIVIGFNFQWLFSSRRPSPSLHITSFFLSPPQRGTHTPMFLPRSACLTIFHIAFYRVREEEWGKGNLQLIMPPPSAVNPCCLNSMNWPSPPTFLMH